MRPDVQRWYERRTYSGTAWRPADLVDRKGDATISVVLPAHNEAATVGGIVSSLRREFMQRMPLIDEVVVVDSRSADATCSVATAAGARVVSADALLPEHGAVPGKGEALWKSLHAVSGDIVVFLDADLDELPYQFVPGLLGPLLADASISYVKAAYDRPLLPGTGIAAGSGGRVTELVARPLLNLHWPQLAGFLQPLAGEYAGRRAVLEQVPFVCGYGVELALLIDLVGLVGLDAMAQVDLGRRGHRNRPDAELGRMAAEIWLTALSRLPERALDSGMITQFRRTAQRYLPCTSEVTLLERPAMAEVTSRVERLP